MNSQFEPLPAGQHHAVVFALNPLGRHRTWDGREMQQYAAGIEFPDLHRIYWQPLEEPATGNVLAQLIKAAGHAVVLDFKPATLVGTNGVVEVTHREKNGRTYSNIRSFMVLPGKVLPVAPSFTADLRMPDWLQNKIARRLDPETKLAVTVDDFADPAPMRS